MANQAAQGKGVNASVVVGGNGGSGNTSGTVAVTNSGPITTAGDGALGIYAQSIGGGGGFGGNANSLSLQLGTTCTVIGVCSTPEPKPGLNSNIQVTVGGNGGTGDDANTVDVENSGYITTLGKVASAIVAESIGGGGGDGGNGIIGLGGLVPPALADASILTAVVAGSKIYASASVSVGGFGGASGNGKAVAVNNSGTISTAGESSYGIDAYSIGGGGGNGGNGMTGLTGTVGVGGKGASSGNGGDISVDNSVSGSIFTTGLDSTAIFAQSVGGGGGNGGNASGIITIGGGIGSTNGSAGNGGKVTGI
jgi:hypothetical protein